MFLRTLVLQKTPLCHNYELLIINYEIRRQYFYLNFIISYSQLIIYSDSAPKILASKAFCTCIRFSA